MVNSLALFYQANNAYLFVLKNGFVLKLPVTTGDVVEKRTEIVNFNDMSCRDTLVTGGDDFLNSLFDSP
jgi:hypothetical protein